MKFADLLRHHGEWLKGTGPVSDIVMSSRVRLARNLDGYSFFNWSDKDGKQEVLKHAKKAVEGSNYLKDALFVNVTGLRPVDKFFLVERHLMSREHAESGEGKGLIVEDKEVASVMINEEDHIRMQVIQSGFNLTEAWRLIDALDTDLGAKLDFSFSPRWGYLTACPTNTGTGMRASVMLHLPALVMSAQIGHVLQAISKFSVTARGFFGEGTDAMGNFFQISNQMTLGRSEDDIISDLEKIVNQIITREKNARAMMLKDNRAGMNDRIWRAYGTLKSARIITSEETIKLLSLIRLGIDVGTISDIDRGVLNELLILTQPAHLQEFEGKEINAMERDIKRADLIRDKLEVKGR